MSSAAVQVSGVTLLRQQRPVLDNISFTIPAGSFVGVLGGNGAGKTTLFRTLLGLEKPSAGQIWIEGQPTQKGRMSIGYMPQVRGMVAAQLSGWSMVAAAQQGWKWGLPFYNEKARADIDAALAAVDAQDLASCPVGSLSGGERQRLMLAQALLDNPRILLLDEPLASLDPARMRETAERIYALAQARGMTVLMSTHDINPLMGLMDHVLYMAHGKAVLGRVEDVMTTQTLSAFYGAPVEVVRAGNRLFVVAEGGGASLQSCMCVGYGA
ncbi:iron transporter [Acetobacter aceti 1023]|nr:iron transporter [Acetobacter aceti 1023]